MKLHLDGVNLASNSGPNTFAQRLVRGLLNRGEVELVDRGPGADVSLVFIEPSGQPLAHKVIQRLDGIWFKPEEFRSKNVRIKALYESADAVVWQSDFDRKMTTRWWSSPQQGQVIHNGIELAPFNKVQLQGIHDRYDTVFVASSNWHPQKRLKSNVELFNHLRQWHPNSCLIVMGSNPHWVNDPNVFFAGSLPHAKCFQIYEAADWMLHLAWLDHCPNVVIEALSRRVPVVCASSGGTHELVQGYGVIVPESQEYGFELADYDSPPPIDVTQVSGPLPNRGSLGHHAPIGIETVCDSYVHLFNRVLQ